MKIQTFLIAFIITFLISAASFAEYGDDGIECDGKTITYNDDGSVTLKWDWDEEGTTYASVEEMYMDWYGFLPPLTWEEGGYDEMFNTALNNNSSSQSGGNGSGSNTGANGSSARQYRRIYTVKEANDVSKDGSVNKIRLRYK